MQKAIRNAYLRAAISRNPNRVRFSTSRAMSRTSNTYMSSNGNYMDSSLKRSNEKIAVKPEEKQAIVVAGKQFITTNKESLTML